METSELTGKALNYWVAKAEGFDKFEIGRDGITVWLKIGWNDWQPATRWEQAGPIIERERISLTPHINGKGFDAAKWQAFSIHPAMSGEAPLIAAMRAYVASKFGGTVPDEPT